MITPTLPGFGAIARTMAPVAAKWLFGRTADGDSGGSQVDSSVLLAALSSMVTNVFNAREAANMRDWQAEMSNSAYTRAARDMRRAGVNPALLGRSGEASTPSGAMARFEDPGASAMAARAQRAQIELIEAQAHKTRVEAYQAQTVFPGQLHLQSLEQDLKTLDFDQRRQLLPLVLQQAKAEIERTVSSARAARASAILDEMMQAGAANQERFEKEIGALTPWARAFMSLLRGFREVGRGR